MLGGLLDSRLRGNDGRIGGGERLPFSTSKISRGNSWEAGAWRDRQLFVRFHKPLVRTGTGALAASFLGLVLILLFIW